MENKYNEDIEDKIVWEFNDRKSLNPGEYYGIGKEMYKFTSKKKKEFVKFTVGIRQNYDDGVDYIEVDKVLPAEFYRNSELYKSLEELDLIKNNKVDLGEFTNIKIKVYLEPNNKEYVKYSPVRISNIERVEEMPEESEFIYKVNRYNGLLPEFKPTLCKKISDVGKKKLNWINSDDDDDDFE